MVRYSNLANIVERSGNLKNTQFFLGQATTHPNFLGETKHTLGVKARQEITVAQRNRQSFGVREKSGENGFFQFHIERLGENLRVGDFLKVV